MTSCPSEATVSVISPDRAPFPSAMRTRSAAEGSACMLIARHATNPAPGLHLLSDPPRARMLEVLAEPPPGSPRPQSPGRRSLSPCRDTEWTRMLDWLLEEATNQTRFRTINESIETTTDALGAHEALDLYICECGDAGCHAPIRLSRTEYEIVRTEPTHF